MGLMPESIPSLIALEPLVESAIRSTTLIAIAALAVLALRRAPASVRHLVWTLALLGCVAMPFASRVVPGWSLPLPAWKSDAEPAATSVDVTSAPPEVNSPAPSQQDATPEPSSVVAPPDRTPPSPPAPAWRISTADVIRALPLLWLAGVVLLVARHLIAWALLARIARRSAPMIDHAWLVALARHGVTLRLRHLPALRVSPRITVPIVCGTLRPTIILPVEAHAWNAERRDAVLLHELAHVRRFDLISARVTQLASTLYWFNPFVWLAARAQRAEAERACDDQVLDAGGRASAYATDLLEIARSIDDRHHIDAAALAMARRSQLEGRLLAILDPRLRRGGAGPVTIMVAVLLTGATIVGIAAARPAQSRRPVKADMPALVPLAKLLDVKHPNQGTNQTSASAAPTTIESAQLAADPGAPVEAATDVASDGEANAEPGELLAGKSDQSEKSGASSHWSVIDNGKGEVRSGSWHLRDRHGSFKSKGTIRYSSNLDDIVSVSPGGYVEAEDRRDRKVHRLVLKGRSGDIERSYSIDGDERPWDSQARAWFSAFLIDLDHGSGAFVDQRFPRLMNEGGPSLVMREVSEMTSDYGRGIYFKKLFASDVDASTLRQAVAQAGREIGSDYELTQALIEAAKKNALDDPATRTAYLEAVNSLQSDYEHGRALQVLIARRDLSPALVDGIIASADKMTSDYEQAQVMIALAERGHVKGQAQRGFMRASHNFDSDYERGRVLTALLEHGTLASENIGEMLLATATFSSDYERANVLIHLAESVALDNGARAAFIESTKGLSSDYERERALAALGKHSAR
ncbi:MAG TPA: M56 family metallopeptidase [Candidatus Eisenbacteria bacterium]|nr:M56 family metallopeptidase [Candidatus Eisenbacteria bacterium]